MVETSVGAMTGYKIKTLKLRPANVAAASLGVKISSNPAKQARRDHDALFATFWRRLGLAKPAPVFMWGIEDEVAVMMAKEIAAEIDREIIATITGMK